MILATYGHTIAAFFFAVMAIFLMIVILLQRGRGVGLAGAFGGAGGGAAFGAKTGDVLTWVTIVGAILLLTFTVLLNYIFVERGPGLTRPAGTTPTPSPGSPQDSGQEGAWYWDDMPVRSPVAVGAIFDRDA